MISRYGNIAKKIRTYNFARGTVKDHRTGVVLPLREVLSGNIQKFIDANKSKR